MEGMFSPSGRCYAADHPRCRLCITELSVVGVTS